MHDLKLIRSDAAAFDAALARRGVVNASAPILAADAALRAVQTALQTALARRNEASKAIGAAKAQKDEDKANALMAEVSVLKAEIAGAEAEERERAAAVEALVASIPNLPADDVPDGTDEHGNVETKRWGTPRNGGAEHDALAEALGWNPEGAAKLSGARFMVLGGQLARLHRALGQFMLDRQVEAGWRETVVPLLVRDDAMYGTGQLPKFAEDLFRTTDGRWLIPTAEVSLTNLVREQILDADVLPLKLTALTPCFRSEAGAAGKDTRGLIRQHQFEKVELVTICKPDESDAEHERMLLAAEAILEALELPYRRMLLCAGDMGFSARKTFDLEVWLPGAGAYREISSVSNCGDFQARRMDARWKVRGDKGTNFVHTLNGSGLAVGRTLVAVLENHQQPDGSVRVPDVLKPYMGGIDTLIPGA
ncbi:serine--tRNA ligase [Sandaracinobacter neustonicus]|uniref:Serine--tRNA ligase n=1 Tax=Sandaracinobacter neustonicus TaxID=1715348 RepID=A0A501XFX2_9SPHN|nr:serine--tRNA ligase [Sandaracinobacter neustonicus]TPE59194.1 serine--tRNA ligase [Sandaracinobacter neustonicus]